MIGQGGVHPFPYDEENSWIEVSPVKNNKIRVVPIDKNKIQNIGVDDLEYLFYPSQLDWDQIRDIQL